MIFIIIKRSLLVCWIKMVSRGCRVFSFGGLLVRVTIFPKVIGSWCFCFCEVSLHSSDGLLDVPVNHVIDTHTWGGKQTDGHPGRGRAVTHVEVLTSTGSGQRALGVVPKDRTYSFSLWLSCSSMSFWGTQGPHWLPAPGPSGAWLVSHVPSPL